VINELAVPEYARGGGMCMRLLSSSIDIWATYVIGFWKMLSPTPVGCVISIAWDVPRLGLMYILHYLITYR